MDPERTDEKALVVFQGKTIRKRWLDDEGWYSVIDVIGILTKRSDPRNYWKVLKHRLNQEGGNETVTYYNQFKMLAEDGKMGYTDCLIQGTLSGRSGPYPEKTLGCLELPNMI